MNNYNKNYKKNTSYKKPFAAHERDTNRKNNKIKKKFKQTLVRKNLYALIDKTITISVVINKKYLYSTMGSKKPILVTDCVLNSDCHTDHFWITITETDRTKLCAIPQHSRVYMTGTVYLYQSQNQSESAKVGIGNLQLVSDY